MPRPGKAASSTALPQPPSTSQNGREALLTAQGMQDESGDEPPELPEDPAELAYLVAAAMILDLSDKQLLLAAPTVDDRLRLALTLLKREASMVTGLSLRPAVELPRTPYASN